MLICYLFFFVFVVIVLFGVVFVSIVVLLIVDVYNLGVYVIFLVLFEIVLGKIEVILIDVQFQCNDVQVLVSWIKVSGKMFKVVYVSYSDFDYYFGLEIIYVVFLDVKIVVMLQIVVVIEVSKDGKFVYWGLILKDNVLVLVIVLQLFDGNMLCVDGELLCIVGFDGLMFDCMFVWIFFVWIVVGGILVVVNIYVWMVDMQMLLLYVNWLVMFDWIDVLKLVCVVFGYFLLNCDGSQLFIMGVVFMWNYVKVFDQEVVCVKDLMMLIVVMEVCYLDFGEKLLFELSVKVVKGEMQWFVLVLFFVVGKMVCVQFGVIVFDLNFKDDRMMLFVGMVG